MPHNLSSLAVIAGLEKSSGGPSFSVPQLREALAYQGIRQFLVTAVPQRNEDICIPADDLVSTRFVKCYRSRFLRISWCPNFRKVLLNICRESGIKLIHNHGIWTMANHAAAVVAKENKLPLIQTVHGMLNPWCMRHRAFKKKIAWTLYQKNDLSLARVIHATSREEGVEIGKFGFSAKVVVIPNGIELRQNLPKETTEKTNRNKKTVLFLGRIYPVKGLVNLIRAWSGVANEEWRLLIVGPNEAGHQEELARLSRDLGVENSVEFRGRVDGEEKWKIYSESDVFVLPSFSENFGLVVGEAMAAGLPVITTQGTPWRILSEKECGWWIPLGVDHLTNALSESMRLSDVDRSEMGRIASSIISNGYSWSDSARKMRSVYDHVLGGDDLAPDIEVI